MEIREMKERPTMCIKTTTPVENLPQVFGEGYAEIMEQAGKAGIQPTGGPYALYLNEDMSNLQIEFGFPIAVPLDKQSTGIDGRVEAGVLPGGKTVVGMHEGPYETIEETYNTLMAYVKKQGMEPTGISYEVYLNDPRETPPEELKTEIYFPVKE
jgi:effector-binding domain-containing protein